MMNMIKKGGVKVTKERFWELFLDRNNNIALHCTTKEEAVDFCKMMDSRGLKWCTGDRYTNFNAWKFYKKDTCYSNRGEYCGVQYYSKEFKYMVVKYSDVFADNNIQVELL